MRETAANRPRRQLAVFCSDITAKGNELREIIPPTSILIYKRSISLIACTILRTSFVMWEDRCVVTKVKPKCAILNYKTSE